MNPVGRPSLREVDVGHRLAQDLVVYVPMPPVSGVALQDLNRAPGGYPITSSLNLPITDADGVYGRAGVWNSSQRYSTPTVTPGVGSGDFTFGAHIRTHTSISGFMPIAAYSAFSPGLYQHLNTSNWGIFDASARNTGTSLLSTTTWYTLIAGRKDGVSFHYLNGKYDGGGDTYTDTWPTSAGITVGFNGSSSYFLGRMTWFGLWFRALSEDEALELHQEPWCMIAQPTRRIWFASGASAAITGTVGDGATETEIQDTGGTIIITLTGDTWVAAGATFDAQRQNIINGLDAASSPTNGWNNEIRDVIGVSTVVRTSDTVVTVTIPATATYSITANETVTVTVPASALVTSASPVVAAPTITITDSAVAGYPYHAALSLMGVGA